MEKGISPKGGGISIYDLVALIITKLGEKPDNWIEIVEDRKGQDSKYIIDSSKVRNELGWVEKIDLDKGIDKVITWVETFYEELVNLPQEYIHKP